MTRTVLAIATALLAATTLFGSGSRSLHFMRVRAVSRAQRHFEGLRGKVVRGEALQEVALLHGDRGASGARRQEAHREERARREEHRHRRERAEQDASENENSTISATASSEPAAKKVETAATTPVKAKLENENSTISTAAVDLSENTGAKEAPIEAASDRNVGCKKYFPTVGMTLSVRCE